MHWVITLLYLIRSLLHVSAFICHLQGASCIFMSYLRGRNGCVVVMYCKCWWAVCTGCCGVCYVVQLSAYSFRVLCCPAECIQLSCVMLSSWEHTAFVCYVVQLSAYSFRVLRCPAERIQLSCVMLSSWAHTAFVCYVVQLSEYSFRVSCCPAERSAGQHDARHYNNQCTQPTNVYSTWLQHNHFCL
jgi:hypothetical protein